jgi:hypothetical protein
MALQLQRRAKGVEANYWKITKVCYDALNGMTYVTMNLYLDKNVRLANANDWLESITYNLSGCYSISEAYTKIKESKIEEREVTPTIYKMETKIADGSNPLFPAGTEYQTPVLPLEIITPAVMEDYETNQFALAIDC